MIDTSVLIAILANEAEAELFETAIDADPIRLISAASVLDAAIVAGARYGDVGGRELDLLLYKAEIQSDRAAVIVGSGLGEGRNPWN